MKVIKKIWSNIFLKGFLGLSLFLLLLGFTGVTSASASEIITFSRWSDPAVSGSTYPKGDSNNYALTIPATPTDLSIVCISKQYNSGQTASLSFNGVNFTLDTSYEISGSYAGTFEIWTLNNPSVGTYYIGKSSTTYSLQCLVYSGLNQSDLIASSTPFSGVTSPQYYNKVNSANTDVLAFRFHNYASPAWADNWDNYGQQYIWSQGNSGHFGFSVSTSTDSTLSLTNTNNINVWYGYFIELNKITTPSGVQINEFQYSPVTGNVFISGTCQTVGSGSQQMNVYAFESGTSTPNYLNAIPNSNSGINGTFSNGLVACINNEFTTVYNGKNLTGSMRIVIDDSFYGTTLASEDITWQSVTGFIDFNYGTNNTINIDTTAQEGATTTLSFRYNICDDPYYSATTSKIYLGQQDGVNYSNDYLQADSPYYLASTCSGVGSISFHMAGGAKGSIRAYFAYANIYDVVYLKSNYFYLVFDYADYLDEQNPFLTAEVCGDESNPFSTTWCVLIEDVFKPTFLWSFDNLMTVFPFVIIKEVKNSWDTSASFALPDSLAFLNFPDVNGNLQIGLPDGLSGETDKKLTVFGAEIFTATDETSNFFGGIRNLSTYFLWALFSFAIYRFGVKIVNNEF